MTLLQTFQRSFFLVSDEEVDRQQFRETSVAEILNLNYKIYVSKQTKLNTIGSKFVVTRTLAAIIIISKGSCAFYIRYLIIFNHFLREKQIGLFSTLKKKNTKRGKTCYLLTFIPMTLASLDGSQSLLQIRYFVYFKSKLEMINKKPVNNFFCI